MNRKRFFVNKLARFRQQWFLLFLAFFWLIPTSSLSAFDKVETEEGLILVREDVKNTEIAESDGEPARNPFNWAPELIQERQPVESKIDERPRVVFHLSGILWDEKQPVAIIDDLLLKEGDLVKGALVREINPDEVMLEQDGEFVTLRFKELLKLDMLEFSSSKKTKAIQ